MNKKAKFRLNDDDWDDEEEDEFYDEEDGECPSDVEVIGPSYAAVYTGLLHADGSPIIRHPVVMKVGFHPPDKQFHAPTLEENEFAEGDGKIYGWVYD